MRLPNKPLISMVIVAGLLEAGFRQTQAASEPKPIVLAQAADDDQGGDPGSVAAMTVRIDRMEGTIRSLTGQIEQLQFQNRKLTDDLRKMQQDVDFRFQDLGRTSAPAAAPTRPSTAKRTDATAAGATGSGAEGLPQDASGVDPVTPAPAASRPVRRVGDAFDPDANPDAPGTPRPLGTSAPSAPLPSRKDVASTQPSAPLELIKRPAVPAPTDDSTENGVAAIPPVIDEAVPPRPAGNPNSVASLAPGGTRDEYNGYVDLYRQGQFESAATGLRGFLDKYPRDRMVPDAVYVLGDAYAKLGRHREAAEQYLRLSTDFAKAPRAPDALLKLGVALNAMGVREQACATYQEVTRRYPAASSDVKAGVDRELKRARC